MDFDGPIMSMLLLDNDGLISVASRLDTMENWDEKKLEEVVNKKHGEAEKKKPKTQIVRTPTF